MEEVIRDVVKAAKRIGRPKATKVWAKKAGKELKRLAAKRVKEAGLENVTLGDLLGISRSK